MTTQIDQRTNMLIGHVQGCPVLASYLDDGRLGIAGLTWQGLRVGTDADSYVYLSDDQSGCEGEIDIAKWRSVRDLVQCDVIEELTALALAHQWIAPIDGYTPEDEIATDTPSMPALHPPTLPSIAELESQMIALASQIVRQKKEPIQ